MILLRNETDLGSPKDTVLTVEKLYKKVSEIAPEEESYVAITDYTMYAVQHAYDSLPKEGKIKLIPGCLFYVTDNPDEANPVRLQMEVLAKDEEGYKALCRMQTESQKHIFEEKGEQYPMITKETIVKYIGKNAPGHGHVNVLTGGVNGIITGIEKANSEKLSEGKKKTELYREIGDTSSLMLQYLSDLRKMAVDKLKMNAELRLLKKEKEKDTAKIDEMSKAIKKNDNRVKAMKETMKDYIEKMEKFLGYPLGGNLNTDDGREEIRRKVEMIRNEKLPKFKKEIGAFGEGIFNPDSLMEMEKKELLWYKDTVGEGNLFSEITAYGTMKEKEVMFDFCRLSEEENVPVVAVNRCKMAEKDDFEILEYVNGLHENKFVPLNNGESEMYIKTDEELLSALTNSVGKTYAETAMNNRMKAVDGCSVDFLKKNHYPIYPCSDYTDDMDRLFAELTDGEQEIK